MKVIRFVAVLLLAIFTVMCCACTEQSGGADVSSSQTQSGATSENANSDTVDLADATLTVKVKKGEIQKFKSDRPYDESKEDISIILVIGQSNFTPGVGFASEYKGLESGKVTTIPEIPTLPAAGTCYSSPRGKSITALVESYDMNKLCNAEMLNKTWGGVTPSFGVKWHELTGTKVVFIQAAVGATGLHEWMPNSEDYPCDCNENEYLYSKATAIYRESYKELSKNYNVVYTGYIWDQGAHEEKFGTSKNNSAINSDEDYYNAYKIMHDSFMEELDLDFGGISMPRSAYSGDTAEGSMTLTSARKAQYRLCNDFEDVILISTIQESCTIDDMDQSETVHFSQKSYNKIGADCAENLFKCLGLGEKVEFSGVEVYSAVGKKLITFDKDGNAVGDSVIAKGLLSNNVLAKISNLGTNYKIEGLTFTAADGTDLSSCIDKFGVIDWTAATNGRTIKTVKIKCVIE